jgi:hypothetical protein
MHGTARGTSMSFAELAFYVECPSPQFRDGILDRHFPHRNEGAKPIYGFRPLILDSEAALSVLSLS